jgi:hypothetical protein
MVAGANGNWIYCISPDPPSAKLPPYLVIIAEEEKVSVVSNNQYKEK